GPRAAARRVAQGELRLPRRPLACDPDRARARLRRARRLRQRPDGRARADPRAEGPRRRHQRPRRARERGRGRRRADAQLPRSHCRLLPVRRPPRIPDIVHTYHRNSANNIPGGSRYGYTLLWVIVSSNLMAMLIQTLSAKLGIATGRNLAEVCRDEFPRRVTIGLWIQAEAIAIATDLAEFLGAAIGLQLLTGIGLLPDAGLTAVAAFAILGLQRL